MTFDPFKLHNINLIPLLVFISMMWNVKIIES
jgi:hypothetical protein